MMLGPNIFSRSIFGTGARYGNITGAATYDATTGTWTVTGAATVDISAETGSAVLMCKRLVVNGGTLTVSTNCKGLLIFASISVQLLNGGQIHINKLGKAGNFGNLTPFALLPAAAQKLVHRGKLQTYVILGEGALGATGGSGSYSLWPGVGGYSASSAMQTGGGGAGAGGGGYAVVVKSGNGGKGGPLCGGAGSGSIAGEIAVTGDNAGDYGGPATAGVWNYQSRGVGGGAGDPVGESPYMTTPATGAGGGLLMIFTPSLSIASGCIVSSDGGQGGSGSMTGAAHNQAYGGGSAGGGCVCVVTKTSGYTNSGTVRASGGAAATAYSQPGGAGGAGSVNVFAIAA